MFLLIVFNLKMKSSWLLANVRVQKESNLRRVKWHCKSLFSETKSNWKKRLWHSKAERKQLASQLLRLIKVVLASAILRTHEYKIGYFFRLNEPNPNWLISNFLPWGLTRPVLAMILDPERLTRPKNSVYQIYFWFLDWTLISIHLRLTHTNLDPKDRTRLSHKIWLAQKFGQSRALTKQEDFIWRAFTLGIKLKVFFAKSSRWQAGRLAIILELQLSCSRLTVVRQSSGSHQVVIRQSSNCHSLCSQWKIFFSKVTCYLEEQ